MSYEKSGGCTLQYTYTNGFGLIKRQTPLLICIEPLPKLLYIDLKLLSRTITFGKVEPNSCLFKLSCRQNLEISHKTAQLAAYTFGPRDFQMAH